MKGAIVTIGFFDGIHTGHRRLLNVLAEQKNKYGYENIVLTFDRPPRPVAGLLTTPDEKLDLLALMDIDRVEVLEFSGKLSSMLPEEFFEKFLLPGFPVRKILAGYDFSFGKNRSGNISTLRKLCVGAGIDLLEVGPVKYLSAEENRSVIISSSRIRDLLVRGQVEAANSLLGRQYSLTGRVVKGAGIASKLGFPTLNMSVAGDKLLPEGIFCAQVLVRGKICPGVLYIGRSPTLGGKKAGKPSCEAHLLGVRGRIAAGEITVFIYRKLRGEKKFKDAVQLKKQIAADVEQAAREINNCQLI
jgi:riboflavin kinase / FMN adenylyltransferase